MTHGGWKWTYKRGKWSSIYWEPKPTEKLFYWRLLERAKRLGVTPSVRWLVHGLPPPIFVQIDTTLKAVYISQITRFLNTESPLWRRLK